MNIIWFDGKIQKDNEKFFEFLRTLIDLDPGKEKVTIYFCSNGGNADLLKMLLDVFNSLPYIDQVEIVPLHFIASCGFDFLVFSKCVKRFIYNTVGMTHLVSTQYEWSDMKDPEGYYAISSKELDKYNNESFDNYLKIGITNDEISDMKRGLDVYFNTSRLKQLCKKALGVSDEIIL